VVELSPSTHLFRYPSPPASFSLSGCTYISFGSGCSSPHIPPISPRSCIRNEMVQPHVLELALAESCSILLPFSPVLTVHEGGSLAGNDSCEASSTRSMAASFGRGLDSCFFGFIVRFILIRNRNSRCSLSACGGTGPLWEYRKGRISVTVLYTRISRNSSRSSVPGRPWFARSSVRPQMSPT
jgi:hypothetical protein